MQRNWVTFSTPTFHYNKYPARLLEYPQLQALHCGHTLRRPHEQWLHTTRLERCKIRSYLLSKLVNCLFVVVKLSDLIFMYCIYHSTLTSSQKSFVLCFVKYSAHLKVLQIKILYLAEIYHVTCHCFIWIRV